MRKIDTSSNNQESNSQDLAENLCENTIIFDDRSFYHRKIILVDVCFYSLSEQIVITL